MREMKKSGLFWLGNIPINWDIIKFSQAIDRMSTGLNPRTNFVLNESNDVFYVTIRNFKDGRLYLDEKCDTVSYDAYKLIQMRSDLQAGDILFASISDTPQTYLIKENPNNWNINESVFTIRCKPIYYVNYFNYCLNNIAYYNDLRVDATGSTFLSIKQNKMLQSKIPLPNIEEQKRIADFLDTKCSEIDALTADIQSQIETLEQYKKSVITEAVTKGLDPDAEMKDSGIEWIGQIPKGWQVMKTLYVLSQPITDGPHTTPQLYDDGVPFVSAEAVSFGKGKIDFNHIRGYISEEFYRVCCQKYIPQINDIYMIKSGATTGRVSIVDTDVKFTIWSPLAVFRCDNSKMLPIFLYYSLQSDYYQNQVQDGWSYGTQQNIGMRTLEKLKVCVPNITEQKGIADYLDAKCTEIDSIVKDKQTQLDLLADYKKSLIYEYVTGKKEVPNE